MVDTDDGFVSLLTHQAHATPHRLFARFNGTPITFGDVDRLSSVLARWLREQGLSPGDRVAVMLRNSSVSLALLFGLGRAGAVWVPINVHSRGDNLAYILTHCDAKLVIAEHDLAATIEACGAKLDGTPLWTFGEPALLVPWSQRLRAAKGSMSHPPRPTTSSPSCTPLGRPAGPRASLSPTACCASRARDPPSFQQRRTAMFLSFGSHCITSAERRWSSCR